MKILRICYHFICTKTLRYLHKITRERKLERNKRAKIESPARFYNLLYVMSGSFSSFSQVRRSRRYVPFAWPRGGNLQNGFSNVIERQFCFKRVLAISARALSLTYLNNKPGRETWNEPFTTSRRRRLTFYRFKMRICNFFQIFLNAYGILI